MEKDKGFVLVYDRVYLPEGYTFKQMTEIAKTDGFIMWDSTKCTSFYPSFVDLGGNKNKDRLNWKLKCVVTGKISEISKNGQET